MEPRTTSRAGTPRTRGARATGRSAESIAGSGDDLGRDLGSSGSAEQLERLSNNLRDKDVNELLQDAQRLARRQPALFIGGSFAVGLLAARFLKSSREDERSSYGWSGAESSTNPQTHMPGAY
jgi:hypothetical protein